MNKSRKMSAPPFGYFYFTINTLKSELVDIIVWGEGESVFPIVLKAIEENDLESLIGKPGVGIKVNGKCSIGPNSGYSILDDRVFDLPYHLLDMKLFSRKLLIGPEKEFQIWTSRGCPYRCAFCSNSSKLWPNTKMRNHTIEHIVRDVSKLHREYGADCITFADEGFLQDEKRFIRILEAIRNEGIFIKYRFSARIDILLKLKPETWEKMKECGVIAITTAPESGSQRILDYMEKGITLEQIYKVDGIITKYNFFKAFNILGTQGDGSFVLRYILPYGKINIYGGVKMPRKAREKSSTGIYHVVLRGINRQIIFEEDEDYKKFLQTLQEYQETSGYEIYGYCLMSNHVHLLIKEGEEDLGIVFRRIGARYVYWYNWKYNRRGHLFQDRYKSEAVENDGYFLTVLRYIHQNPLKAGIVKHLSDYPWSSYSEYIENPTICSTGFGLRLFSNDPKTAIKLFKEFNAAKNSSQCLEYDQNMRWKDPEAIDFIKKIGDIKSPVEIQNFEKEKRDEIIKICKDKGLSIRQLERLTGISFGVIRKIGE